MICPFCKEEDFDAPGLKFHLMYYCDVYAATVIDRPALFATEQKVDTAASKQEDWKAPIHEPYG